MSANIPNFTYPQYAKRLGTALKVLDKHLSESALDEASKSATTTVSALIMQKGLYSFTGSDKDIILSVLNTMPGGFPKELTGRLKSTFISAYKNYGSTLLSKVRKEKGLTQKELAEASGFSQTMISRWENGSHAPSSKATKRLAEILGVHAEEIIDD